MVARVAADLERIAHADEDRELPDVLRLFPYREARLAVVALPKRLRDQAGRMDRSPARGAGE